MSNKKSGAGGNPTTAANNREQDKFNAPNGLNYISLIKNFWRVNIEHNFTPQERSVFFYLAEACNCLSWRNPFTHSRRQITHGANISPTVYKTVLERLHAAGLIEFTPGRPGYRKNDEIVTSIRIIEPPVFVSVDGNRVDNVPVDAIQQSRKNTENVPYNKLNNSKREGRKIAPPSLAEIEDCMKTIIQDRELNYDYKKEAREFADKYEANEWRNGSRVKIQAHNLAANCANWLNKVPVFTRRQDLPPEPPKPKTVSEILNGLN